MATTANGKAVRKDDVVTVSSHDDAENGNVDKIRDILFGAQMQDYERRFATLEARLNKEAADLRDDIRSRLDGLEGFVKKELDSLSVRLKNERRDRSDKIKDLTAELNAADKELDRRVNAQDEHVAQETREIREQILATSKSLSDDLTRLQTRLTKSLDDEVGMLRADKTDRSVLAALLAEMALRLADEVEPTA